MVKKMSEDKNKKGLTNQTIIFMLAVALFFDALQTLLAFIFMDWLVSIFAGLTFYLWFKIKGMSFMKPKRLAAFGGASLVEMIPALAVLPAWTASIAYLAIDSKIKKVVPKLDIIKRQ